MPDELGLSEEEIAEQGDVYDKIRNGPNKEKIQRAIEANRERDWERWQKMKKKKESEQKKIDRKPDGK